MFYKLRNYCQKDMFDFYSESDSAGERIWATFERQFNDGSFVGLIVNRLYVSEAVTKYHPIAIPLPDIIYIVHDGKYENLCFWDGLPGQTIIKLERKLNLAKYKKLIQRHGCNVDNFKSCYEWHLTYGYVCNIEDDENDLLVLFKNPPLADKDPVIISRNEVIRLLNKVGLYQRVN